jgi:hypothetical protein
MIAANGKFVKFLSVVPISSFLLNLSSNYKENAEKENQNEFSSFYLTIIKPRLK